jgi:hypothetical protein
MWRDKAVALAQTMTPGEYWTLDNVRMKVNNSGYIEGSFSEAEKAQRLSTADVDTNPHLQALLQCVTFSLALANLVISISWLTGGRKFGRRTTRILTCFPTSYSTK